ncbi:MAG TPA: hypothetical protein VEH04_12485 [Verrucomicrobiae bacterium]|nr:hypothetical protein [Verrucomicrobiae bacterium]
MKHFSEQDLESQVDRALKALPEIPAPQSLARSVLARAKSQSAAPWYQRPWHSWPVRLRAVSFGIMLAAFPALYFGIIQLINHSFAGVFAERARDSLNAVAILWNVATAIAQAGFAVIANLGPLFFVSAFLIAAVAYAACIGIGTLAVKLALTHRSSNPFYEN